MRRRGGTENQELPEIRTGVTTAFGGQSGETRGVCEIVNKVEGSGRWKSEELNSEWPEKSGPKRIGILTMDVRDKTWELLGK